MALYNTSASLGAGLIREEQLQCPICLHLLCEPVTTACGHNYCRACLEQYWSKSTTCLCPLCKEVFATMPHLRINTVLRDMVELFQSSSAAALPNRDALLPASPLALPGEVVCDVCSGGEKGGFRALKSCLDCGTSFCAQHLELHQRAPRLQKHTLTEPLQNLEERVCVKHGRPLELFCREDDTCVCVFCMEGEHKGHNTVSLDEESKDRKTKLGKTQADLLEMILDRMDKISEIKQSVEIRKRHIEEEVSASEQLCSSLKHWLDRSHEELRERLQEEQSHVQAHAQEISQQLQQEIATLKSCSTHTVHLLHTHDNLRLLQAEPSLCKPPAVQSWAGVQVDTHVCVEAFASKMEDTLKAQLQTIPKRKLQRIQRYEVNVHLDPLTAHPNLLVSSDGREVRFSDKAQKVPASSQRFDCCACVLACQRFSSGRHYFQVRVADKTLWGIGVVSDGINRHGELSMSPEEGFWLLLLRGIHEYWAADHTPKRLTTPSGEVQTVGVFLDYEGGIVAFWDVEQALLLFTYRCCSFPDRLRPFFSPYTNDGGANSAPLVITPVNQTA